MSNSKENDDNNINEFLKEITNNYLTELKLNKKNFNFNVTKSKNKKLNYMIELRYNEIVIGSFNINIESQNNNYTFEKTKFKNNSNYDLKKLFLNPSYQISPMNYILPVKKITKINDNVMIISYNEEYEKFIKDDLYSLLQYIKKRSPSVIIVSTQESASRIGNKMKNSKIGWQEVQHFQHILKNELEEFTYGYKMQNKCDSSTVKGHIGLSTNKNVRMRIYKKNDSIEITNNEIISSSKSGFGEIRTFTVWKGSIMYELKLNKGGKQKKFIFVNSHLFFDSKKYKDGSGIKERKKMFMDLVNEFKLNQKYEEGYNIFFMGDLNFRLTKLAEKEDNEYIYNLNETTNDAKIKEYIVNIVRKHLINIKNNENNTLYKQDEIYEFLDKNNKNDILLYNKFKESIEESRTFLSFKYGKNMNLKELYDYSNQEINNLTYSQIKNYFKTENSYSTHKVIKIITRGKNNNNKLQSIIKPPSNPDRILYALCDVKISKNDLKIFLEPRKSDHKMIALNFDLRF